MKSKWTKITEVLYLMFVTCICTLAQQKLNGISPGNKPNVGINTTIVALQHRIHNLHFWHTRKYRLYHHFAIYKQKDMSWLKNFILTP